ncbi:MAG: histidine--tRNA ligase [Calditrichaeota bacterium]|nr:MAG: histidine--tRNA ligase [Calditrichota bacterium]
MSKRVKPRLYKGTRDFLPEQMVKRQFVIEKIRRTFECFGFEPLETPSLELWETLAGKYGEEADRLTYRFVDRGGREVGLRYDLTVPLSRVVALYPQIPKPFKRYQIQPVWRADKPQKGRFREFYQCDVDIVGSPSVLADAEIIAVLYASLSALGFQKYRIRINSRKILAGIAQVSGAGRENELAMCRAIDKLDKIGLEGVRRELQEIPLEAKVVEAILAILDVTGNNEQRLEAVAKALKNSEIGSQGVNEMRDLFTYLQTYEIPEQHLQFDLYLSRGLDYYTGPIFETVVDEPKIGSITGGGRYDNLIGLFTGQPQPATGSSIGLERIVTVMEELGMFPPNLKTPVQVLVTVFDADTLHYSIQIANLLRRQGLHVDLYTGKSGLRGQIGLANDKGIPLVIIAGPDEMKARAANLKNMIEGTQETVPQEQLSERVKVLLQAIQKV